MYAPGQFDAITPATLLLAGSDSVTEVTKASHRAAAAIPTAEIRALDGHGHFAHTDPIMVDALIRDSIST